jgi:hypothetical protein
MTHVVTPRNARFTDRADHRDGSGHLDPAYEADLRARVRGRTTHAPERAFVHGTSSANVGAEQSGEEFVMAITTGEEGGAPGLDEVTSEERGGPFLVTHGRTEFAYDVDESNPADGTREPFPKT